MYKIAYTIQRVNYRGQCHHRSKSWGVTRGWTSRLQIGGLMQKKRNSSALALSSFCTKQYGSILSNAGIRNSRALSKISSGIHVTLFMDVAYFYGRTNSTTWTHTNPNMHECKYIYSALYISMGTQRAQDAITTPLLRHNDVVEIFRLYWMEWIS